MGGGDEGIYTTKFFEYVGAGRSILAIGATDSDVGKWIRSAELGKTAKTANEVADQLTSWYEQKRSGGVGYVMPGTRYEFTRDKQFGELVRHLQTLFKATE